MNYKKYFVTYYNYKQAKIKLQNIQNEIADIISSMLSTTSQMREVVNSNKSSNDKMMELTTRKIELVFTCKENGLYAIELKENEKLYIE